MFRKSGTEWLKVAAVFLPEKRKEVRLEYDKELNERIISINKYG